MGFCGIRHKQWSRRVWIKKLMSHGLPDPSCSTKILIISQHLEWGWKKWRLNKCSLISGEMPRKSKYPVFPGCPEEWGAMSPATGFSLMAPSTFFFILCSHSIFLNIFPYVSSFTHFSTLLLIIEQQKVKFKNNISLLNKYTLNLLRKQNKINSMHSFNDRINNCWVVQ